MKIVQVLTGPEVEPASNEIEWSMLDADNLVLDSQETANFQTIIILPLCIFGAFGDSMEQQRNPCIKKLTGI